MLALCASLSAAVATAQVAPPPVAPATSPATPPAKPAAPPSVNSPIRGKVSAGDLLSAESILEVHKEKNGEDNAYLEGMSWLARGALLVGDARKAHLYAADVRRRCDECVAKGASPQKDEWLATALGASIEVEAQLLAREKGKLEAADYVRGELERIEGPVSLRSRLNKRLNLLTLENTQAPEVVVEDFLGDRPNSLASLRGKPVLLFVWAEWCADCKAQAATLARIKKRYESQGLQVVALTRYYAPDSARVVEKARVDSVWKAVYAEVGDVPRVFSTASMERYGGSSTPTMVFIDRAGVVRWYTPTRLTEAELDRAAAMIAR
jgi:thiol-disulfide isomerase/thioredoxin